MPIRNSRVQGAFLVIMLAVIPATLLVVGAAALVAEFESGRRQWLGRLLSTPAAPPPAAVVEPLAAEERSGDGPEVQPHAQELEATAGAKPSGVTRLYFPHGSTVAGRRNPRAQPQRTGEVLLPEVRDNVRIRRGVTGERRRPPMVRRLESRVSPAGPASGRLNPTLIEAEIKAYVRQVKACADEITRNDRSAARPAGRLMLRWWILPDGSTSHIEATGAGFDADLLDCVHKAVGHWRFTPPAGGIVRLSLPFVFQ